MNRGYPYLQGQPNRPYRQFSTDAGSDVWLELQFLDRSNTPATPTAVSYRIDNLTDAQCVLNDTSATPTGTTMEINIPASVNVMQRCYQSSQLNQVTVTSTFSDGSIRKRVFIYELIAINTVGGA